MEVPSVAVYVLGGGISLFILKEAIGFIKWGINLFTKKVEASAPKLNPFISAEMSDRNLLELILGKTDAIVIDVGEVKVEVGVMKTKMDYMGEIQKEQNGLVKELSGRVNGLQTHCAKSMEAHNNKFTEICERLTRKADKRKRRK